jgi:hypothetical protein
LKALRILPMLWVLNHFVPYFMSLRLRAQLRSASVIDIEDIQTAIRLVFMHRITQLPATQQESEGAEDEDKQDQQEQEQDQVKCDA